MSGNDGVIKEFLVRLGYQIDGSTEKKFRDGIKSATEVVAKLGVVAPLTATAVVAAITKMAYNLDALYFSSQRTKASADNIRALDFAASQMGSSAESAQGALESIAKFMSINPGGESLIHSWGIQTRQTNGELRDTTEIMGDLGKLFRNLGTPQAYRRAQVLGIDYPTLLAMMKGMDDFEGRYKQILAKYGLDTQKAADQSHQFMLRMRDLKANAEVLGTVIGTRLIGVFDELAYRWDSLDEGTKKNIETFGKWTAAILAGTAIIAGGPAVWIGALAAAILGLWDDYKVWKEGGKSLIDWGKWKPEIDLAKAGINLVKDGLHNLISLYETAWPHVVDGWHDFTAAVKDAYAWVMKVAKAVEDSGAFKWVMEHTQGARQAVSIDFDAAKKWLSDHLPASDPRTSTDVNAAQSAWDEILRQVTGQSYQHGSPDNQARTGETQGIRSNNPGNLRTGPGGSFGSYASPLEGLQALRHQLALYGNGGSAAAGHRHLDNLRDIISTYAPSNDNNTAAYIADVARQMGIGADAKINLSDPQVMESLMRGIIQHENGYNPYQAEMLDKVSGVSGPAQVTGGRSLAQTTNINVYGATDPQRTATAVAGEQIQVNERLTRDSYFSPAI